MTQPHSRAAAGRPFLGRRAGSFAAIALLTACGTSDRVSDPINGVPLLHQQTISRAQLGFRWPLIPGTGTLACADGGVILFRSAGVTYVVQGERPGAADISRLRIFEASAPPSNPVRRLTQNVRMEAFVSLEQCRSRGDMNTCLQSVRRRFSLSADEAQLVEAEGQERRWPPLSRRLMPLDPLVAAGRALCGR
ncbi:MAG TPA: hypothetical protein VL262_15610 [Vicinamibacterales bacterium]|nr:hypothetical protein [Vicinamibacterales bacterium]